jgi:hypothetical protein
VVVPNEPHLDRRLSGFVADHRDDRTHLGLGKETPSFRKADSTPDANAEILGRSRIGGLHHRCERREAIRVPRNPQRRGPHRLER